MRFLVIHENCISGEQNYIGFPYQSEAWARTAIMNDFCSTFDDSEPNCMGYTMSVTFWENKTHYIFTSNETGEILGEYFILCVFL